MLAKYFLSDEVLNEVEEMGRELNRDLVIELKAAKARLDVKEFDSVRQDLNKQRIKALNLKLIPGGKID